MIQITMHFNTISEMLKALGGVPSADVAAASVKEVKDPKPAPAASPAATPAAASASAKKQEPAASQASAADVVDLSGEAGYKVLQQAVFKLAGKDKPAVLAINASFGVATMKDLPEAKRAEALALVTAKIAELGVA